MWRRNLADLPAVTLPGGYTIRPYEPGLDRAWEYVIGQSFGWDAAEGRFRTQMRYDYAFRPERVLFVFRGNDPVATASAWYRPHFGRETGYLHMVGVLPAEAGRGLGLQVSLACLHRMAAEGRRDVVLETDDFRIAAVKTYLKLDFVPRLVHENQRQRWRDVLTEIGRQDLIDAHAAILNGPLREPVPARPDSDHPENFVLRHKWLPDRAHRGGRRGGGDVDFMADESLYHPLRLGMASVVPSEVLAGSPMQVPLTLAYTAGPAGLPTGASVTFVMRGQRPLGFGLQTGRPDTAGNLNLKGPPGCGLEPVSAGFRVRKGCLREGQSVQLVVNRPEELRWTPLAGRREFKVVVNYGNGEPEQRLPAPVVITIQPRSLQRLEATIPCTRTPGEPVHVHVTARDEYDNRAPVSGEVEITLEKQRARVPMADGVARARIGPPAEGAVRAQVRLEDGRATCESNVCIPAGHLHLYVGDLHCHDLLSEAEGYPDAVFDWAINDRNLDFVSVVPQSHGWHDNETWTLVKYMNERFLGEGRFVTFLGFEWQHTGYGDKVVHYLGGDQPVLPVDDSRYNSAPKLYEALRASDALIISHHPAYPAGSWCAQTDFDVLEYDVERLVELWSMHGSAEGYDLADRPYHAFDERNTVMAALSRGARLGFVAGSDTHSARPGGSTKEPMPYWGGLTAVWAKALTRRDLFEALYARRTYALTGARVILRMTVNNAPVGSELPAADKAEIRIDLWAPGRVKTVQLLKNTRCLRTFQPNADECHLEIEDATAGPAFYHCRVTLENGQLAVCSPVWVG